MSPSSLTPHERKEFAAWKFDTIDLLTVGLDHREARVAICLLGRMNRTTRLINPSQRWVSVMLDMDESAVRRAIKKLVTIGLLEVERDNRQRSNRYAFSTTKLNEFYDIRQARMELARAISDREEVSAQKLPEREETPGPEQEEPPSPDREEVSAKHLKGTIEGNHEDYAMIEESYNLDRSRTSLREKVDGEASPQGERDGGGFRARWIEPTAALIQTEMIQRVARSPLDSLNEQFGRADSDFPGDRT